MEPWKGRGLEGFESRVVRGGRRGPGEYGTGGGDALGIGGEGEATAWPERRSRAGTDGRPLTGARWW